MRLWLAGITPFAVTAASGQEERAYPFSGFFGIAEERVGVPEDDLQRCALSFLEQRSDGTFATCIADLAQFGAEGKLSYKFDDKVVSAAIAPEFTTLRKFKQRRLMAPAPEVLHSPEVAALAAAVGR